MGPERRRNCDGQVLGNSGAPRILSGSRGLPEHESVLGTEVYLGPGVWRDPEPLRLRMRGPWWGGGSWGILPHRRESDVSAEKERTAGSPAILLSAGTSGFPAHRSSLETARLRLRAPTRADLPHVQRYAVREDFFRYLDLPVPTRESVERFFDAVIAAWDDPHGTERVFAIEPKEAGRLAGLIRIRIDTEDCRRGSVGFSLDPDFQGRGYATEALVEVVRMGFEEFDLPRIWAEVDTRNEKSWKVLERAGFRREKRMPSHRSIRGLWTDSYLYAICRDRAPLPRRASSATAMSSGQVSR